MALFETATRITHHRRLLRIGLVCNLAFGSTAVVCVFGGYPVIAVVFAGLVFVAG